MTELGAAFADALDTDATVAATLLLDGFVPLDPDDNLPLLDLAPAR